MKTSACIFHDTAASLHDRRVFEIVEEAFSRREKVVVFAGSEKRAADIDRFLWVLRQDSFIPHRILRDDEDTVSVAVAIITTEWNPFGSGILVVDGHCSLEFTSGFGVVHEFVDRSSPEVHQACRDRYSTYRDKKIPVEYLKTDVWNGSMQIPRGGDAKP